ncbi:MAG: Transcription factor jumonji [Trebouxia sp. A1-2]|nr:MAG: Transcription factor jumonji [Trebouxia sp. A1-2]
MELYTGMHCTLPSSHKLAQTPPTGQPLQPWNISNPTLRATTAGSVHALHYDMGVNTLLVMLQGRKAVTLIPPEQIDYLYPFPLGHIFARRAQVDLEHPDYVKYPLSRLVRPRKFVMHPGDMLFFSAGTPHSTVSLTDVISLTFRMVQ